MLIGGIPVYSVIGRFKLGQLGGRIGVQVFRERCETYEDKIEEGGQIGQGEEGCCG
jgi:hypothetical protein